ncbi:MAG: PQQ-binding-like beta-propeller repeat protein [Bacteroidota bacterium]
MKKHNYLFILSNGRVAAINKKDGSIAWEIKLKDYISRSLSYSIGQLSAEGDKVYIGCCGVLVCLNAKDGSLVWKNDLKGWGYQFVSLSNATNEAASAAAQEAAQAAVVAAT